MTGARCRQASSGIFSLDGHRVRTRVQVICSAASLGEQGRAVRRLSDVGIAVCAWSCSRCQHRCDPHSRSPQQIGVLAPRLAFRQQGRGHPAVRLARPRTPGRQPGALLGETSQPVAPQVIGGHPVRMGRRAPGHHQQRCRQPARGRSGRRSGIQDRPGASRSWGCWLQ